MIFYQRGGAIQKIIDTKTGVADIRSATIIDFIYAIILLVFKVEQYSHEYHLGILGSAGRS